MNCETAIGPKMPFDLNFGRGLYSDDIVRMLAFAFNGATAVPHTPTTADALWDTVTAEIDAERPIVTGVPGHAIVISGYYQFSRTGPNARWVTINDPWRGRYLVNLSRMSAQVRRYWLLSNMSNPKLDEATIARDSDGDGIVDFDEVKRFKTQPANRDSDHDGVDDKTEVYTTVYDPAHGHARWRVFFGGRDFDEDLKFMEMDADSDAGGCKDGQEDTNANGKRDAGETYNFDKQDDRCPPPPLGGRVHIAYAYSHGGVCIGRVAIDTRFPLHPELVPGASSIFTVYHANEMTYDIRTDGCADLPGDHVIYRFDEGFHLTGTTPLTADNLGQAVFWPGLPVFGMQLPQQLTEIGAANSLKGSYTGTEGGGGPWPSEEYVEFTSLDIRSDPACTDPSDETFARPDWLDFCTEPMPCADTSTAPSDCFSEPQRYLALPFNKSFRWAPPNEPGGQYQIGDVAVIVEICDGCGGG